MSRPTPAQLRFLLALVEQGGEGYGVDMVRRVQTIHACKDAGWVEYRPVPGEPFEIGKHVVTDLGRRAALDASPYAYKMRLEAGASKAS